MNLMGGKVLNGPVLEGSGEDESHKGSNFTQSGRV